MPKGQSESVFRRTANTIANNKIQKDKQQSTKHTNKIEDWVEWTPLKRRCTGIVSSSCSTRDTRPLNLCTNPVISHVWGKDRQVLATKGTYPSSFVTQIFHSGRPSHGGHRKTFEVMISTQPGGILGSVTSLLAATLYQGN
jgi:hypothetical protein